MKITTTIEVEFDPYPSDELDRRVVHSVDDAIKAAVSVYRGMLGPKVDLKFVERHTKLMKGDSA